MAEFDLSKPVHLIVNPHSGYGGQSHVLGEMRSAIRAAGLKLVEFTTRWAGDATDYARGIVSQAGAVVAWGGDGTAHEIADGLLGSDVPLVPCPAGTENLLAKELGIPSRPRDIVDVLLRGRTLDCDIGMVNGKSFMLIIGVGFDGEVVRRLSAHRSGHISHLSYFWPIWRTFWEHDFPRMRIVVDGQEIFNDFGLAFIGNISRYAVGLRICRDAVFNDGLLDLVVFTCQEQSALLLHAAWTLLRMHPLKGNVLYRQFRTCRFETQQPVPSQIDGDVGPSTPLDIAIAPHRVRLLVPPRRSGLSFWPWRGEKWR